MSDEPFDAEELISRPAATPGHADVPVAILARIGRAVELLVDEELAKHRREDHTDRREGPPDEPPLRRLLPLAETMGKIAGDIADDVIAEHVRRFHGDARDPS